MWQNELVKVNAVTRNIRKRSAYKNPLYGFLCHYLLLMNTVKYVRVGRPDR